MTDSAKDKLYKNMTNVQNKHIENSFFVNKSVKSSNEVEDIHNTMKNLTSYLHENQSNSSPRRPIMGNGLGSESGSDDHEETSLDKASVSHLQHILRPGLIPTDHNDIELHQSDPNDPLYSVKTFKELNLNNDLLKGILQMNFRKPSGIQEKALPILLSQTPKNLIAQSQSGTGKTATFLLTMFSKINLMERHCQCLCMAPTRELAVQIAEVAQQMSKFMEGVRISCAIKGYIPEMVNGEVEAHIVIGTPGTIKFWVTDGSSIYVNPRKLKVLVLDEADVLLENPEFLNISRRIKSKLHKDCQILLFSATYEDHLMEFAREFVPHPNEIRVKPQELTLKNIRQFYITVADQEHKYSILIEIFGKKPIGQCIVFCESRRMAAFLHKKFEEDGHLSSMLTGDLDVIMREQEINNFRTARSRILIATNLCSRGIDIPQVNLIVNWDMPRTLEGRPDCETYLHRIGRSGRFGKTGLTINFLANGMDKSIQDKIAETYGALIEEMTDLEVVAHI